MHKAFEEQFGNNSGSFLQPFVNDKFLVEDPLWLDFVEATLPIFCKHNAHFAGNRFIN